MSRGSPAPNLINTILSMIFFMMMLPVALNVLESLPRVQEEGSSASPPSNPFAPIIDGVAQSVELMVAAASFLVPAILGLIALKLAFRGFRAIRDSPHSIWTVGVEGRPLSLEAVDLGDHDDAECLTCGRDDGPGVRRGYVEEVVLAGLPVWETNRSETYDCAAHTDRSGLEALGDEDEERDGLDIALDANGGDEA